jgi:hypothetical protein
VITLEGRRGIEGKSKELREDGRKGKKRNKNEHHDWGVAKVVEHPPHKP